jgi:hypothetical protein
MVLPAWTSTKKRWFKMEELCCICIDNSKMSCQTQKEVTRKAIAEKFYLRLNVPEYVAIFTSTFELLRRKFRHPAT